MTVVDDRRMVCEVWRLLINEKEIKKFDKEIKKFAKGIVDHSKEVVCPCNRRALKVFLIELWLKKIV